MKIKTLAFGEIEIDDDRVMTFVGPMLGFEGADRYVLLDVKPDSPFKIMQLVDNPAISFLVADPMVFFPDYTVQLSKQQVEDIGLDDPTQAAVLVVVNISDDGRDVTANLRAPVVVNVDSLVGKQMLLQGTDYALDHPLPLAAAPEVS